MGPSEAIALALVTAIRDRGLDCYQVAPQASDGGAAAAFPYVQIGAIVFTEWDTKTETGIEFDVRLHTRWRGSSTVVGRQIQDELFTILHNQVLTMDSATCLEVRRILSTIIDLPDGSFDGVCEYRGQMELNA
jgi:hypothetical protein